MIHKLLAQAALATALLALVVACGDDSSDVEAEEQPIETMDDGGPMAGDPAAGEGGSSGAGSNATGVSENPDGVADLPALPIEKTLPIIFVHGFAGSAQQYESQAMRFVANGYPRERIRAFDHDGAGLDLAGYVAGVDAEVDRALQDFGVDQVYLVGHSRGTLVSSQYLGDPARAAKVAKYVALDGSPCPAAVPCIAPNQAGLPGQAHVEVATSKESFAMQYEFFLDEAPEVVDIVPQIEPIELMGRAVNFPANTGRAGTELNIWEIDSDTGMRVGDEAIATFEIGEDGNWGPVTVDSRKRYEFVLSDPTGETASQHHLYLQRYLRSSHLVRLLSGGPDSDTRVNTNSGDGHSSIVAIRMREWYAMDDPDNEGDESDVLEISTSSESGGDLGPDNVITSFVGNGAIGLHFHDDAATPGETTLGELPFFSTAAFQNGVDIFMPAADPPDGTITLRNLPRGDADKPQIMTVPNWPSSTHAMSVMFADFPVD